MAEANLKLLGEALRTFREQAQPHKISQFRLASLMRWEGTAPIIEIEKGRRLPRPETLNALGEALQLSHADIAYLHGLAGYRAITVMPPLEQVKRVLQAIEPEIAQALYPIYIMDYQFRFWMMNPAAASFEGVSFDQPQNMMAHSIDAFAIVFDSRLPIRNGDFMTEAIERESIFRFKSYNLYRRHEPFYLAYPACMQTRLLAHDYATFVQRWHAVDVRVTDIFPAMPQLSMAVGSVVLKFEIHMVELLHLERLFFAAYYVPKNDGAGNRERCDAYFSQYTAHNKACRLNASLKY
jgi:Helix-turn-helix domain